MICGSEVSFSSMDIPCILVKLRPRYGSLSRLLLNEIHPKTRALKSTYSSRAGMHGLTAALASASFCCTCTLVD